MSLLNNKEKEIFEDIVKKNFEELGFHYEFNFVDEGDCAFGYNFYFEDLDKKLSTNHILGEIESRFYSIMEDVKNSNIFERETIVEKIKDEINSDCWFSGFSNVKKENLNPHCFNSITIEFCFEYFC